MSPATPSTSARLARLCLVLALAAGCAPALAEDAKPGDAAKPKTSKELLDASTPADWRTPDPSNILYMQVPAGRVVIELAPRFAPEHVANIRALAHGHYWDGLSIYRSQDNFVVQFGDPTEDEKQRKPIGAAKPHLPAEFTRPAAGLPFDALPDSDGWAPEVGFSEGFPAARDPKAGQAWMAHCYGTLGAGRDVAADSSNGTELYVVDGQSPRGLDRNITVVGRVLKGMELLSVLPRGPEPMGMYEKPEQYTPILSIALEADVPEAQRTPLQVLRTDTPLFAQLVEMRRNRRDEWYKVPAGHIDLCNVAVPVRTPPKPSWSSSRRIDWGLPRLRAPHRETTTMPTLRMRLTGSEDDARAVINLLQSLDGIEHVEEVSDLMPHMDDADSSSAGLSDIAGPDAHELEIEAPNESTARKVREAVEALSFDLDVLVEFEEEED